MIRKLKFGKRFIAGLLTVSIISTGICSLKLYKNHEINRVKRYLNDFLTEDNYVDLSKVPLSYDITGFQGEYLLEALKDCDINYVRIADTYIYDKPHVTGFIEKNAVNYHEILGIDQNGDTIYAMYQPIAIPTENGVTYSIPSGYTLENVHVLAEPTRYEDLKGTEIKVIENDYEDSYSLYLTRHGNK